MTDRQAHDGTATVQSVDRAVTILELLSRHSQAGVTEVAAELGVHKSTAFRLLGVLERRGLVEQVATRGKYRLGLGLVLLANAAAGRLDLAQVSGPVCASLAEELGETVNVAILEAGAAVNVAQARGTAAVASHNWVGQATPLHATSSGKVLLAHLPAAEAQRLLTGPLTAYTGATVTDQASLARELESVRGRGYGTCREELEVGLNAVAAPIRSREGRVVAAISVAGPSYRLPGDRLADTAGPVCRAAEEISARLGLPPEPEPAA